MDKFVQFMAHSPQKTIFLRKSGTQIIMAAYNGNVLSIGSDNYLINTDYSLDLSATTLMEGGAPVLNTQYNIYCTIISSTPTLKLSATTPLSVPYSGYTYRTGDLGSVYLGTVFIKSSFSDFAIFQDNVPNNPELLNRSNHTGGQDASTITSGIFDIARIPQTALSRLTVVADQAARFALTTAQVQNGDTVLQTSPNNTMYYVVDETQLNSAAGYAIYTAVTDWATLNNKPQIVQDLAAILSPSENDILQYKSGAWVKVSLNSLKVSVEKDTINTLTSSSGNVVIDCTKKINTLVLTENVSSWSYTDRPTGNDSVKLRILVKQNTSTAFTVVSPATKTPVFAWSFSATLSCEEWIELTITATQVYLIPSGVLV